MAAPIRVTRTVPRVGGGFCPCWPEAVALSLRSLAEERAAAGGGHRARLLCYTTPAVTDVGGASACIRLEEAGPPGEQTASTEHGILDIEDGGYVLGLRPEGTAGLLPAIAGVPGHQGLDRYGGSRVGLAECLVMARPLEGGLVTYLHEEVLRAWLPEGCALEVVLLARLTDFFLGLNAGTWLRIRISEISLRAKRWAEEQLLQAPEEGADGDAISKLLSDTGLAAVADVEEPPPDASELWQHWGCGGNTGVSGQVTLPVGREGLDGDTAGKEMPASKEKRGDRFDFCLGEVDVSVDQWRNDDRGGDVDLTGDLVWPTAFIFCKYLCDHSELLRGRRVLDMGAGTGLVGLVAASLGAIATLVDVPRVLPLLTQNVATMAAKAALSKTDSPLARAAARELWWGEAAAAEQLSAERGPFDVVLCCEVVYQQTPRVLEALRQTLDIVLARTGGIVIFAYQPRDGAELTDAWFFQSLTSHGGLKLLSEESMAQWDDSWDDTSCRFVRTYCRQEARG